MLQIDLTKLFIFIIKKSCQQSSKRFSFYFAFNYFCDFRSKNMSSSVLLLCWPFISFQFISFMSHHLKDCNSATRILCSSSQQEVTSISPPPCDLLWEVESSSNDNMHNLYPDIKMSCIPLSLWNLTSPYGHLRLPWWMVQSSFSPNW